MASEKSIWIDSLIDLKNSTSKFCGTLKSLAVDSICSLNPEESTALISCDPDDAFAMSIEGWISLAWCLPVRKLIQNEEWSHWIYYFHICYSCLWTCYEKQDQW